MIKHSHTSLVVRKRGGVMGRVFVNIWQGFSFVGTTVSLIFCSGLLWRCVYHAHGFAVVGYFFAAMLTSLSALGILWLLGDAIEDWAG